MKDKNLRINVELFAIKLVIVRHCFSNGFDTLHIFILPCLKEKKIPIVNDQLKS